MAGDKNKPGRHPFDGDPISSSQSGRNTPSRGVANQVAPDSGRSKYNCAGRSHERISRRREAFRMNEKQRAEARLTPAEQSLTELWEKHLGEEFTTRDTEATLETMVPDAYVNHIPVLTGGVGLDQLRVFYSQHFIPKMPP